ncbi:MAG: hypothetical protein ABSF61_04155 [Anaerolineales bacterium]|jgi:hypothetical protein
MGNRKQRSDSFGSFSTYDSVSGREHLFRLEALEKEGIGGNLQRLPYSIRILLESLLRNLDGAQVSEADVERLAGWDPKLPPMHAAPFKPARVLLQGFTGVPAVAEGYQIVLLPWRILRAIIDGESTARDRDRFWMFNAAAPLLTWNAINGRHPAFCVGLRSGCYNCGPKGRQCAAAIRALG